jgi:hypothetical protein
MRESVIEARYFLLTSAALALMVLVDPVYIGFAIVLIPITWAGKLAEWILTGLAEITVAVEDWTM